MVEEESEKKSRKRFFGMISGWGKTEKIKKPEHHRRSEVTADQEKEDENNGTGQSIRGDRRGSERGLEGRGNCR